MTPSSDARSVLSSKVTKSYSWRTLMILLLSVHIVRLWTVFVILFLPVLTVLLMEWFKPIWDANLNAICWLALLLSHRNTVEDILRTWWSPSLDFSSPTYPSFQRRLWSCTWARVSLALSRQCGKFDVPRQHDTTWPYSEFSKFVQHPDKARMTVTDHTLRYLRDTFLSDTFDKSLHFSRDYVWQLFIVVSRNSVRTTDLKLWHKDYET